MRIRAGIWVRNQPLCARPFYYSSFLPLVFVARRDATGTRTKLPAMLRRSGGSGRTPGAWGLDRAVGPRVIEEEVRISELPTLRGWWSEQEVAG
jgi:hypothetical protein